MVTNKPDSPQAPGGAANVAGVPFLDSIFDTLSHYLPAPPWLLLEVQRRLVLALNHVLMAEPTAQARLVRQRGRVLQLEWREFLVRLAVTPAGLFELLEPSADAPAADLSLAVLQTSPTALAQGALRGDKPPLRIEGDIQLAAEINWLADHLRWDVEQDLSRIVGDAAAHTLAQLGRQMLAALRGWLAPRGGTTAT